MSTASAHDFRALARAWSKEDPDESTRAELQALLDADDESGLKDRFASRLEFGTAGLRGVLGAGPNRMNRVVVIRTTAGLGAFLLAQIPDAKNKGVLIGYDGRRRSREFAEDAAEVLAGLGLRAMLFSAPVPTPLVGFGVQQLRMAAGIVVTASHNPPEYNGYKVFWSNGAQIIPPHDKGIAAAIDAVGSLTSVARPILKEARARGLVVDPPSTLETQYVASIGAIATATPSSPLRIAYTPMHGVGRRFTQQALATAGFTDVHVVPEQAEPDGNFPTVRFPNPEEPGALDLVLALAQKEQAALVLANDPDADRLAAAVPGKDGQWVPLTGNELGILLGYYLLAEAPNAPPAQDALLVTTVVSSPMLPLIARTLGAHCEEVLTGFKWITNRALEIEAQSSKRFLFGYEEALGYAVGTAVRDKDGISAAAVCAQMAAFFQEKYQRSLLDQLDELYRRFGLFLSTQKNHTAPGSEGAQKIQGMMERFRQNPPSVLGGQKVVIATDLLLGKRTEHGKTVSLTLPASDVLSFTIEDGSRVTLRPSGTEPKIKFYFDLRQEIPSGGTVSAARIVGKQRLDALVREFLSLVGLPV